MVEKARFDTSNYPEVKDKKDSSYRPLEVGKNKKVIGMMKDEVGGKIITEFVSLRPKMYAYKMQDKKEDNKCKGTKKCVVEKTLTFDDYKKCLFDGKTMYRGQMLFENKDHEIYIVNKYKIALNRDDDKRIIQEDGISTLAIGYSA